ncbi:MAG TPA: secretin N-terminal domain-containing protein [Burkholderiaceae bacterium]|nr:secretin N-terminal domain-containing protein [Burkholderiaceae bacterium]HPH12818.1 secretin N-terminal domain-containing protein [Burkholderiaceae bacterium]
MKTTCLLNSARRAGSVAFLGVLLAGCAGMRYHSDGLKLLSEGKQEEGLSSLQKAHQLEPTNGEYRLDMLKASTAYANELAKRAEEALRENNTAAARELFIRALKVESTHAPARRGLNGIELDDRSARLVTDSARLLADGRIDAARMKANAALSENPSHQGARRQLALISETENKIRDEKAEKSAAQSIMNKPVTLQFRDANLRMVFEALSRTTGLNVILDRDVRADLKTTIFVKDAAVEDTVDLILLQNQLEKRTINANTLFIFPATAAKQKEYQDLQVRTFQIGNADVKYLQTLLKTVLKVKDVSVDERSSTLVMRDTPDAIAVAAKVIAAHDVPEPEIMLEVEVLEISHDRLTNLGVKFPDSITFSTPGSTGMTVGALRALTGNDLLVTPLSLGINLKLQDTDANILASPRIRARNKEKARILIGDRVPIITNSVTPTASGTGVVTGSVQYQDVGLKLEFEPQVYNDQEVGIRIALEVSSIVKEISGPSGSLAYQIGTRNANTVVRLQDGETQILGGLISSGDRNTASKVPGIGQLPVLGRLFSNNSGTDSKTEIVLSITPHILRAPASLEAGVRNVYSGTEGNIRERAMQLDPIGAVSALPAGPVATTPAGRLPGRTAPSIPSLPAPSIQNAPRTAPNPAAVTYLPLPRNIGKTGDPNATSPPSAQDGSEMQVDQAVPQ